ncbi:unnamed protein product [Phytophthora fragariaefolia]|uniref:Unnamed protein product n=1 Tax=Phytophthora fragariaefolia TaxID=1490495 RepID=A0A9W7CW89_9STRA|nr:unnamed protein product [Phytophthora fragariaefolia]
MLAFSFERSLGFGATKGNSRPTWRVDSKPNVIDAIRSQFPRTNKADKMATSRLVQRTAAFVEQQLKCNDASHDWRHIERVWTVARALAKEEVGVHVAALAMLVPLPNAFLGAAGAGGEPGDRGPGGAAA